MEVRSPDTAQQSVVGFNNVLYRNVIADANVTYVQKTNTSDVTVSDVVASIGSLYINTFTGVISFKKYGSGAAGWFTFQDVVAASSAYRPTNALPGYQYFDTTLSKPIWWTGTKWVDATGNQV